MEELGPDLASCLEQLENPTKCVNQQFSDTTQQAVQHGDLRQKVLNEMHLGQCQLTACRLLPGRSSGKRNPAWPHRVSQLRRRGSEFGGVRQVEFSGCSTREKGKGEGGCFGQL
jgi:hypothetical protein